MPLTCGKKNGARLHSRESATFPTAEPLTLIKNMNIRTNTIMDKYIQGLGYDFWEKSIDLTEGLIRLINCKLLNENDLIILNESGQFIFETPIESAVDKCKYEDSYNHFYIDDYVARKTNFNDLYFLGLGLEFTKQLSKKLEKEFPKNIFRVLLSFGKVKDPDVYEFGNCVVRFYSIREEAERTFKISDLNDFKEEGILEIEINNQC